MRHGIPTTSWSLILESSFAHAQGTNEALAQFCEQYWPPVYSYFRKRGLAPDPASDLTQGFFARLIERNYLQQADPVRGRFRSFLFTCAHNYWMNELDREHAAKRSSGIPPVPIDWRGAEHSYAAIPGGLTPEQIFDRRWALTIIDRSLARLRTEQHGTRQPLYNALEPCLLDQEGSASHSVIAQRLGMSEGAVKVAAHRIRRRLGEVLRHEISLTVADPSLVEAELRFLIASVSKETE